MAEEGKVGKGDMNNRQGYLYWVRRNRTRQSSGQRVGGRGSREGQEKEKGRDLLRLCHVYMTSAEGCGFRTDMYCQN